MPIELQFSILSYACSFKHHPVTTLGRQYRLKTFLVVITWCAFSLPLLFLSLCRHAQGRDTGGDKQEIDKIGQCIAIIPG